MSADYMPVGRLDDIPPLGGRCVKTLRGPVGVFRTEDDRVFAVDNRCPHRGGPLSEGIVHGAFVTCPLHNAVISLETGEVAGPDEGRVATIPVRVVDGEIQIAVPVEFPRDPVPVPDASAPVPDLATCASAVVAEGAEGAEGAEPAAIPNTATRRVAPKESV